jgi:hypothetical protein
VTRERFMSYYRIGTIAEGEQVGFSNNKNQTVVSDHGKTHHVLYHKYQHEIEKAKALLGSTFEGKLLEEDVVIFLTKPEADLLVVNKLACFEE